MSILVVFDTRQGGWNGMSLEALAAARKMADTLQCPLAGVVMGARMDHLADEAAAYPLEKVWLLDDPQLAQYIPEAYTAALEQLLRAHLPKIVVFPHTYQVRDYAPKLATRFGTVLISDVVGINIEGGQIGFTRPLFQGKLNEEMHCNAAVQFVSVQAGAFRPSEALKQAAAVERFPLLLDPSLIHSKPDAPFRENEQAVDLTAANIIVSVGRGIKEKESLAVVEALASVLGAELAASRPICDNGWLPLERQVGSSGQTVSPKIYFAIGISGAIQHIVGMKGSKTIVAINKDGDAPIFESADYGIVGDLFEVVPALVEELKKAKS